MIDTAGAYILVLIFHAGTAGGITTHEMENFDSCKAALTQLEPIVRVRGFCIAKDLIEEDE